MIVMPAFNPMVIDRCDKKSRRPLACRIPVLRPVYRSAEAACLPAKSAPAQFGQTVWAD
ncbi:Hypothetical protein GbCGDNIH6_8297 [Granulibacter bethesdensis]|nr:Hypothetical protein GbCGDNIH6_8297 [Granulibacter bethesdensis]